MRFKSTIQIGKKIIIQFDGYAYAIYHSSPYHLYAENGSGSAWRRVRAPASNDTYRRIIRAIQATTKGTP